MPTPQQIKWFYGLGLAFMVLLVYGLQKETYWVIGLPLLLVFVYLILFKLNHVLLALNLIIPLAIEYDDIGFGFGLSLPDEPLIMLIMAVSLFRFLIDGSYDKRVLRHPITILILLNLLWYFFTSFTSQLPFVSFKFTMARFWFIVSFYFLAIMLFRDALNMQKYFWLYILGLAFVVIYTLLAHAKVGFTQESSYHISLPFYRAHGIYSAAISFFIPFFLAYFFYQNQLKNKPWFLILVSAFIGLFLIGVFYSYTRAAWLSIMVSVAMFLPVMFKVKWRTQLLVLGLGILVFVVFQEQIYYALSKNKQDSAEGFNKHLQSASNIKTDASNVERINRWMSAIHMFKQQPVLGYGPGTYPFLYASHQQAKYRTLISTNLGNQGGVHSEFLAPLAETGVFGAVSLIGILLVAFSTGFARLYQLKNPKIKLMLLSAILGLAGYFTHGFLNNYSETTKIAPLVWGALAIIVAVDVYHRNDQQEQA